MLFFHVSFKGKSQTGNSFLYIYTKKTRNDFSDYVTFLSIWNYILLLNLTFMTFGGGGLHPQHAEVPSLGIKSMPQQ